MDRLPELAYRHTRLLVPNFAECFRFYRDVLGFDVSWGDAEGVYADFETGETTIALYDQAAMAEAIEATSGGAHPESSDMVALIFTVDSVDDVHRQLRDRVEFQTEPHDEPGWGIRVAHFRDPAGTLIEINEPLDDT